MLRGSNGKTDGAKRHAPKDAEAPAHAKAAKGAREHAAEQGKVTARRAHEASAKVGEAHAATAKNGHAHEAAHAKGHADARARAHPQARKAEHARAPRRRGLLFVRERWPWFAGGLILLLIIIFSVFAYRRHQAKARAAKAVPAQAVPITSAPARKGDIGVTVSAIGTVTPIQSVSITARVQGQIVRVDYKEGQLVRAGDPLLLIDPKPYEAALTQAQGQLAHDAALLNEARIDLKRYRDALGLNAVSKQQVDDQQQVVIQDEGTVKMDQGTVQSAAVNLAYCHITAPFAGRVGLRLVDPGNIVQAGSTTPLVSIAQLQPITVIFSIAEDELPQIQEQLASGHKLAVNALDRTEEKQLAAGALSALDNMVDTTTGTVRLRAQFDNKDNALFPNQFVNAKLLIKTLHDVTLVPSAAVQRNAQGAYVYVIGSDQKASQRQVKTGVSEDNTIQVEGVNPGETVATAGFNKLKDGVKTAVSAPGSSGGNQADAGTGS